jgi:hypothetical protein
MSFRQLLKAAFILAAFLTLASCTDMGLKKEGSEVLKEAVDAFNTAFRWEEYKSASIWVEPDKKEQFWKLADAFKGKVRIIDLNIREIIVSKDGLTGAAILYFQYYRTDSPVVKTTTLTQKWATRPKEKMWYVTYSGLKTLLGEE